jgi:hypothetical protein
MMVASAWLDDGARLVLLTARCRCDAVGGLPALPALPKVTGCPKSLAAQSLWLPKVTDCPVP